MNLLPIVQWLPAYKRRYLKGDLVAGVSSWALVVPQSVAYGQIAGMPAQAGLAAAFTGPLGYALMGTSRQLIVSPTSSSALISASVVGEMANGDLSRFVALSAALAIFTGVVLALLGFLRLGFVSQFLAYAVQTGFLFGLGLTILIGQLGSVLGVSNSGENFFPNLRSLIENLNEINGWTATLGLGGLAALLLMKRYTPGAPAALIVVLAGIAVTAVLGLDDRGVDVVGEIPRGLPRPEIPDVSGSDILALLPAALALAVIGYAESASVAQDFASRHHYEIDPDQELVALGGSSALAGVFQSFLVAGGASQSVANDRAGAQTQLASLILRAGAAHGVCPHIPFPRPSPGGPRRDRDQRHPRVLPCRRSPPHRPLAAGELRDRADRAGQRPGPGPAAGHDHRDRPLDHDPTQPEQPPDHLHAGAGPQWADVRRYRPASRLPTRSWVAYLPAERAALLRERPQATAAGPGGRSNTVATVPCGVARPGDESRSGYPIGGHPDGHAERAGTVRDQPVAGRRSQSRAGDVTAH
jgi:hypothetical protein